MLDQCTAPVDIEGAEHELLSLADLLAWITSARDVLECIRVTADSRPRLSEALGGIPFRSPSWIDGDAGAGVHYLIRHQQALIRAMAITAKG